MFCPHPVCFVYVRRRLQMLWLDTYLIMFVRRFIRSEFLRLKVLLEIEQWRLVKANLLGMTACVSDWKKMDSLLEIN